MTLSKQVINLLGILLVVGVLVAGIALIAVPMIGQAQTTASQARTVAQGNTVYETQIAQLTAAQADQAQLDADTAELRAEIPAATQFDDVFEIAIAAATANELTIQSVAMDAPEAWALRTGTEEEGAAAPADAGATDAGATGTADAAGTDPAVPDAGAGGTGATSADAVDGPRRQALATITVPAPDMAAAAAYVDTLQGGLRLLNPVEFDYTGGILTVNVYTFIRTED